MPNVLDNLAPPGMGNKLDSLPPPSRRDSAGDAVEGVMDGLKEAIKAIPSAVRHPLDSAYQMFEASKDQYEKAVKAAGPGRDNKGDVAGFIQHAVGMFPVLGPMASNLLDAVDSGADSYEVGKRAGNLLSLKVVPEITKKGLALAGRAVDVAPSVGPALKAGAKAAAPDVAAGATKAAGGMALGELLPIPVVKHLVALEMSRPGLRQAGRGLVKGFNAARESFNPTTEAAPIAVSPQLDAFAVRAGFPDFASAPKEIQPLLQNAFEAEVDRLAQTPPTVTPAPAGVTSSGPVRPPVATAAQMMREAGTFRPTETFVPGGPLRPPVRTPAAAPAAPVEPVAPAEMPALQQITEWLASRDGGTASRFTDPVVSEAPITKQTLGDIMDRLMKNRKVAAEVPAATVPAEVPPAAVETSAQAPVAAAPVAEKVSLQEVRKQNISGQKSLTYDMFMGENRIGSVDLMIDQSGNALIGDIKVKGGPNSLGAAAVKGIANDLRQIHPEITSFGGQRVSGVRGSLSPETSGASTSVNVAPVEAALVETAPVSKAPPIQNKVAAGKPVTAATLMEEATKPAGKKVPPFDWTDEAQYKEYQKALREDSNIYGNNRTSMADRVTRFMKKNGIEPTDSGIVKALEQSAEDIAVSPTTGLKRPSFNAADHEVLFDMIKDRMETPTAGAKPVASPPSTPPKPAPKPRNKGQNTVAETVAERNRKYDEVIEKRRDLVRSAEPDASLKLSPEYGNATQRLLSRFRETHPALADAAIDKAVQEASAIAKMDGASEIRSKHLAESLQYLDYDSSKAPLYAVTKPPQASLNRTTVGKLMGKVKK